jgi:hypothetical protein
MKHNYNALVFNKKYSHVTVLRLTIKNDIKNDIKK